jgi:DNA-binding NarL/FixJ family response regulator
LTDERIEILTMTTAIGDLARSIDRFVAGESLMTAGDRIRLRAECEQALREERAAEALIDTLSPQQLRVLRLLATGHRVREVARLLDVSDGTVRSHVKALRQRIGARTQLEAVAILRRVDDGGRHGGGETLVPRPRTAAADDERQVPRR